MKPNLTLDGLRAEASKFAQSIHGRRETELYGVTDGKRIGTFIEHAFHEHLSGLYEFEPGSSASGIDFPGLNTDVKLTSARQPQSSCPFESADQKVYGLGYHLLIFVYDKHDDYSTRTGRLEFQHVLFVDETATADYQTTRGIQEILERDGNEDDLIGFIQDRNLRVDEVGAAVLARRILSDPPNLGYLTISNALQWRLQFGRLIDVAGQTAGVERLA